MISFAYLALRWLCFDLRVRRHITMISSFFAELALCCNFGFLGIWPHFSPAQSWPYGRLAPLFVLADLAQPTSGGGTLSTTYNIVSNRRSNNIFCILCHPDASVENERIKGKKDPKKRDRYEGQGLPAIFSYIFRYDIATIVVWTVPGLTTSRSAPVADSSPLFWAQVTHT